VVASAPGESLGHLTNEQGEAIRLATRAVLGRSVAGGIVIADASVSHEHAVVWWTGEQWLLKDLASRNGTWVGDVRCEPGAEIELRVGDALRLGRAAPLLVGSLTPPVAEAHSLVTGRKIVAEADLLALPSPESPLVSLYRNIMAEWVVERDGEILPAEDLALIRTGGDVFRVYLPVPGEETVRLRPAPRIATIGLSFRHSLDEEDVRIAVLDDRGEAIATLENRAHHYLLLVLARQRLADAALPAEQQGWLYQEELVRMLRTDDSGLNLHVFRGRKALAQAGVEDAATLIERRSGSRQLRIGVSDLAVGAL
jgi:hypothetical protein